MKQRGFTLIELIITIVVLAVIFLGIAGFVEFGTKGYTQSIDRQRLQNQARFAIDKMSREIQYAVPNSFVSTDDASNKCIAFYPIQYSGFYTLNESTGKVEFVVANENYTHPHTFPAGTRLVINPSHIEDLESDGQSVGLESTTTATDGHYFSVAMNLTSESSAHRHFIYQDSRVTTYCINRINTNDNSARILRYLGDIKTHVGVVVATGVAFNESSFSYDQTSLQRGGLVHLDLLFQNGDEKSQYKHDVQVSNVP
ncbi:PilW family protein [Vibrio rarus]|uniref:PilW family protein n=1 Tax=Vibrio rarus TaxID=413403 RepID=UPI0021C30FE1|nr:prepilin-type N-terminal cleavage/methylation domain-containing protein [Vibrio rarus]